jgi:hypothetical protein
MVSLSGLGPDGIASEGDLSGLDHVGLALRSSSLSSFFSTTI